MLRPILLITALVALTGAASTQNILFEEDFNAGIPVGWTNIQLDYTGDIWEVGFGLVNGSGDVFHEGFCDFGIFFRDNILLSPAIDLTKVTNVNFTCDQHHSSAASIFYNAIEVTTDKGATYSVLHEVTSPRNGVSTITANMDAFVGQTVQIALHYQGVISNNWSVDNIKITTPWENLGFSLAGTGGLEPRLAGTGTLVGDDPIGVTLEDALPGAAANLVIGTSALNFFPFYGGTLVPAFQPPDGLFVTLLADGSGELDINSTWPTGLPAGLNLYLQYWIVDPGAPFGLSASNAVVGVAAGDP